MAGLCPQVQLDDTGRAPELPDYFYNDLHQIVQTKDRVLILTEMVHDARIVHMNAKHQPPTVRQWFGDSIGHWEGDTLVVETTNFTDKTRYRGSSMFRGGKGASPQMRTMPRAALHFTRRSFNDAN